MSPAPAFSIIVASYDQPRSLALSLAALERQPLERGEVIIADDGSGEETHALVRRFARDVECPVIFVMQEDRGFRKARALNRTATDCTRPAESRPRTLRHSSGLSL